MTTFEEACERIFRDHISLCLRAGLVQAPSPEIEAINVHECEDGRSAMIYAHLINDEIAGGLPLCACFDIADRVRFDGREYAAAFEVYANGFDCAMTELDKSVP